MRTFRLAVSLLVALVVAGFPAPVLGWRNGPVDGYGSHDWIVDAAVAVLDGRADAWFDPAVARLASDDPDSIEDRGTRQEHTYRSGGRGGAIARIAYEYDVAMAAYQEGMIGRAAGDAETATKAFTKASHHIGLLAHFIGDISQPFHTAMEGSGLATLHEEYEVLINAQQRSADSKPEWRSERRTVGEITNIRRTALATAAYSRAWFGDVYAVLTTDGSMLTPELDAITGLLMQRAAEDLADIIWSISHEVGSAPPVGSIDLSVRWSGVRAWGDNTVYVRALDERGRPIEGLGIVVLWPTSTGTRAEYLYTDATGYQSRTGSVGSGPRLVLRPVVARATVRESTVEARRSWILSPRLAAGSAGFKTLVSDATVVPGQTVRVTSVARDARGRDIPNLLVTWTWDMGGTVVRMRGYTNANGRASASQLITTATTMSTIRVTARTESGSVGRTSSTSLRRSS